MPESGTGRREKQCGYQDRGPYNKEGVCLNCNRETGYLYEEGDGTKVIGGKLNAAGYCKRCAESV